MSKDDDMLMSSERLLQAADLCTRPEMPFPVTTAARDGTPALIKLKDHIPAPGLQRWQGKSFVGCRDHDDYTWRMDEPIGQGGFRDEWIEGWWPLPLSTRPTAAGADESGPNITS